MEHLAILSKRRKLLGPILEGRKSIESRWYASRRAPWDRIVPGDTVYFKETGDPVRAKATVSRVLQFDLRERPARSILKEYCDRILISPGDSSWAHGKRYCILVFLEDPRPVAPFEIDKRGFGSMAAWISARRIPRLRKPL